MHESCVIISLQARDSAAFALADQTVVTVEILDENDNLPFFIDLPTLSISELTPADSVVCIHYKMRLRV